VHSKQVVGFPSLGLQGKNLYVMCVCVCTIVSFCFIKNMFSVINCTLLKSTFGIREIIGFRGMPLWSWVWLRSMISLVTVGDLWY
jgi:hypothetical protein